MIGLKATLITGAGLDIALGVLVLAAAAEPATRRLAAGALAAGVVFVGAAAFGPRLDRELLTSGVFRTGFIPATETRSCAAVSHGSVVTVFLLEAVELFLT